MTKFVLLPVALAVLALPAAGNVHEVPRPTSATVTSAVVECADERGCVVEHACAGTPLAGPIGDTAFERVAALPPGRTAETPRQGSRNRVCLVRVAADDGTGAVATANVTGMRYLKTGAYAGVMEVPLHRARTVAAVAGAPSASGTRTALDYLLERQGTTLATLEGEACSHINREHDEWTRCWTRELADLIDLAAFGDTPLMRCFVELAELRVSDTSVATMARTAGFYAYPFSLWLDGGRAANPDGAAPWDDKLEDCRGLALDVFDRHGIANPWVD